MAPEGNQAAIEQTISAFRRAVTAGDSAAALALFTPAAWTLDERERPLHRRPVRQSGCRGWCRPGPSLARYHLAVLPDSATALAVETYRAKAPVDRRVRRRTQEYTVVSVLCRQGVEWRISSQTQYRQPAK